VTRLRVITAEACNTLLGLFLIVAIVLQGRHYSQATEVVPVGSFAVMLSYASFSISWARVNPPNSTESEQRRVKRVALDMLIGSILTLTSAGLLRMSTDSALKNSTIASAMVALHIVFLAAGLLMGWLALCRMLREAAKSGTTN
jgi:protein-S-isoprenylcysteine O-methyltransferase Ste14